MNKHNTGSSVFFCDISVFQFHGFQKKCSACSAQTLPQSPAQKYSYQWFLAFMLLAGPCHSFGGSPCSLALNIESTMGAPSLQPNQARTTVLRGLKLNRVDVRNPRTPRTPSSSSARRTASPAAAAAALSPPRSSLSRSPPTRAAPQAASPCTQPPARRACP